MLPKIHVSKKYFNKLDLSKVTSPSFVIDLKIIRENLSLLKLDQQTQWEPRTRH